MNIFIFNLVAVKQEESERSGAQLKKMNRKQYAKTENKIHDVNRKSPSEKQKSEFNSTKVEATFSKS